MTNNFKKRSLILAMGVAMSVPSLYTVAAEEETADDSTKMVIVGSRAAPRSVADSAVPVDVISSEDLAKNGSTDMLDMLAGSVPSFNVRAQPISDAATLIRPVNLRGLSSDSTLILVNGKRRHRASVIAFQGGGVNDGAQGADISVIPSIALKQVEVLRDGAAAQYGSDAIAGVMNFILKDDDEGGSISLKQGSYYEGDGDTTIFDANIGLPFTDQGFANFSMQYRSADATSRSVQRPDAAGLIAGGNTEVKDPAQIWGNPEIEGDITIFGNIGLDLGNDKEFYMFGNYSDREVTGGFYYRNPHNRGNVYSNDGGATLLVGAVDGNQSSCPVVPANVPNVLSTAAYQAMVADPNCFSMNMIPGYAGGYTPQFGGEINDTSLTMGTKGDIKTGFLEGWSFDLSGSVGRNEARFNLQNSLNPSLGLDSPSDFDTGAYIQLEKTFNFDLVKDIEVGFADMFTMAMGLEWREESFEIIAGEEASWKAGPYADQGFNIGSHGFKGFGPESQGISERSNIGAYIDMEAQMTDNLLLGGALRYEDFSSFGDTLDYKLTMQYSITDSFSIRGSHSTGFRAPTVGQANVVNTQTSLVGGELIQSFLAPPTDPLSAFYGGKELEPEESESFTLGGVFEDGDFFMTVDLYQIEVEGRLAQSSQINVNPADYTALRALGVRNPELISAVTFFNNDFDTTTTGVDIVANYNTELMGGNTAFSLAYNYNKTEVDQFDPSTTSVGKVRRLEEGIPNHRATFTMSQTWDALSMYTRLNYFGEYYAVHADETSAPGWSETADSAFTVDLEMSYAVSDAFTLSVGANNLFDQEAQKLQTCAGCAYSIVGGKYYESGPFDYNGGFYYLKGTLNF